MSPNQDRWFLLAILGLLVILALGLEATGSRNTMALIGIIAVPIMANYFQSGRTAEKTDRMAEKVDQATTVAKQAAVTADDTNNRTKALQHELNGALSARMEEIVARQLAELDATLDARIRAGVTAVQSHDEERFDKRMRGLIREELAKLHAPDRPGGRSGARR